MNKTIKNKIDLHEIDQVSGGMCNCVGYSPVHLGTGNFINLVHFGSVTYANVCKDLIANVSQDIRKVREEIGVYYLGCYPQDDIYRAKK